MVRSMIHSLTHSWLLQLTVVSTAPINLPSAIAIEIVIAAASAEAEGRAKKTCTKGTRYRQAQSRAPLSIARTGSRICFRSSSTTASLRAQWRCLEDASSLCAPSKPSFWEDLAWDCANGHSINQSIDRSIDQSFRRARLHTHGSTRALTICNPSLNRCKVHPITQHAGRRLSPSR